MNIIISNFGNDSVALIQWALQSSLENLQVVSIDTGFAVFTWQERVAAATEFMKTHHIAHTRLKSPASFPKLIRDRREFPNKKFQWCAALLKGITLNAWLDEVDPQCEATVLLAQWRDSSRLAADLPEFISENEYYNDRRTWHPLYAHKASEVETLVSQTTLPWLEHRSLECDPCIHNQRNDFIRTDADTVSKVMTLEGEIGQHMFTSPTDESSKNFAQIVKEHRAAGKVDQTTYNEGFDIGCGAPWGCGS